MDLKEVLQEETVETPKQVNNVTIHKKPIQLRDIENRSSSKTRLDQFESKEHIMELIEKEKDHIFKQNWNKLDRGLKINRIKEFVIRETIEKSLTKLQALQLSDLLISTCTNNKLNRVSEVSYDKDEGIILSLKNLIFENNTYLLKTSEPKQNKSSGKPKSNIDRFLRSAK
jgi:hypothetical protein|tara:strand:+ start:103 stop:615 length:513 start_codon:yes stop_codon:yes gene_type:complete